MIILGIESSCDETAAAVLKQQNGRIQILSNIVSSSLLMHAMFGGVIPEQAAREQLKLIIPVLEESLQKAGIKPEEIDAIAVTYGPGLIGSLLVGVETAKVLSSVWDKPLIPVNHLLGHFYANWISQSADQQISRHSDPPTFPCIGLLVSGGHTDLVLFKSHDKYEYLGGTRDDAAGECFDKCARVLGFTYPGGPKISKLAAEGQASINFPEPMASSKDFDFSFSGLKTAFINTIESKFKLDKGSFDNKNQAWIQKNIEDQLTPFQVKEVKNICASLEKAIVNTLVKKTVNAAQKYKVEQIIVAGGVAANQTLSKQLRAKCGELGIKLNIPSPVLCTDNGAMIASRGFFEKQIDPLGLQATPSLSL